MYTYIYIYIYICIYSLQRRRLFSILIAPKMAPNKCKLCLHTNLKLKCNLKKCFKMHFTACRQFFLWTNITYTHWWWHKYSDSCLMHPSSYAMLHLCALSLSLSRLFSLIFYNLPSKQFHAFRSENKKMCTMCKSVMNFSAVGAYKRNGQGAQTSPAHNYTMAKMGGESRMRGSGRSGGQKGENKP